MSSKPVIVLVPGAWHSPDCFRLLTRELEAAGYEIKASTHATVGAATPTQDFWPDVENIQQVLKPLAEQGKDILLLVHSYGGVVGSQAVQGYLKSEREKAGKKGGVSHIYFCCAFALPEGTSLMDGLNNQDLPWWDVNDARDSLMPLTPEDIFYNDVEDPRDEIMKLQPHSYRSFATKVTYAGWKHVPSTYLLCEKDNAIPLHAQKGMVDAAQKAGADMKAETMDVSHSPFLTKPKELAMSVRRAAGESAKL